MTFKKQNKILKNYEIKKQLKTLGNKDSRDLKIGLNLPKKMLDF